MHIYPLTLHSLNEFQDIFKVIEFRSGPVQDEQPEHVRRRDCHRLADECYVSVAHFFDLLTFCEPHLKNFDREGNHGSLEWFSNAVFIPGTGSDLTFTSGAHFLKN